MQICGALSSSLYSILFWFAGDKQETAINIAYSSRLFDAEHKLIVLNSKSERDALLFANDYLLMLDRHDPNLCTSCLCLS